MLATWAMPLHSRRDYIKFRLAWKSASDPVTLAGVGFLAGIDQAADRWGAYGQGVQGYAKRYGATYADVLDRKSTRLNSSHVAISYAVFCLKKKRYSVQQ